ncbi:MAG TPA: hypothetical protein VJ983_10260 [candidate division Zixibacteria bacterium]|nr:hypothetical protein [candidate division Zixibacteria bacterium]
MRLLGISSLLALFVLASGLTIAAERPQLYGVSPAYPNSRPLFQPPRRRINPPLETVSEISLKIKKDGSVDKVIAVQGADSFLVNYARPYLSGLEFTPAEVNGKSEKSILPVRVRIQPGVTVPDFFFPVDTDLSVLDQSLFVDAIEAFNIVPPRVLKFPSYSCTLQSTDSMNVYPYALLRISLDKAGELTDVSIDTTTYPVFAQQILSATRFASFAPARVKNKAVSSDALLLVSFFPQVSYPNRGWTADTTWHPGLLEGLQVRLIPAKYGLLSSPLPRRVPAETYPRSVAPAVSGKISVGLNIDSTGTVTSWSLNRIDPDTRKQVTAMLRSLRFFPAIGFDGITCPFRGLAYFTISGHTNIRIDFTWLSDEVR